MQQPCFAVFAGLCSAFCCAPQCPHFFTAHFTALCSPFCSAVGGGHAPLFTAFTAFAANPLPGAGPWARTWDFWPCSKLWQGRGAATGLRGTRKVQTTNPPNQRKICTLLGLAWHNQMKAKAHQTWVGVGGFGCAVHSKAKCPSAFPLCIVHWFAGCMGGWQGCPTMAKAGRVL